MLRNQLWARVTTCFQLLRKEHYGSKYVENDGLKELYTDELKDLYHAENQLVKALPKMAKAATSEALRQGFEEHLEQTKEHVQRLERIFNALDESPKGKKCVGMDGLLKGSRKVRRLWKRT